MRNAAAVVLSLVLVSVVAIITAMLVPRIYGWSDQKATVGDVFTAVSAVLAALAFVAIVVTIVVQGQQLRASSRLATTAILFEYYNAKISSLREAIGAGRKVEDNQRRLDELLPKHERVLTLLEQEFRDL